jgi:hypothetical protein
VTCLFHRGDASAARISTTAFTIAAMTASSEARKYPFGQKLRAEI